MAKFAYSDEYSIAAAAVEQRRPLLDAAIFQRMRKTNHERQFTCLACGEKFVADMNEWDLLRLEHKLPVHMLGEKYGIVVKSIVETGCCNICAK